MRKYVFIFIAVFSFNSYLHASLSKLLTGIEKIDSLKLIDKPQEYVSNDLFVMIDGGAETYIEYGFQQALDAKYLLENTKTISVQIYEMTDDGAAFGIYTATRNEDDRNVGIGNYSSGNDYYIMVQKGKYYYVVSSEEKTPELQKTVSDIAKSISNEIAENAALPDIVKKGLDAGFNVENLKYIRGKIALSSNYFFGHMELFKTRDAIFTEIGECKVFVFQYPDQNTAITNLKNINEVLVASGRYSQFQTDSTSINCQDKNLKHLNFRINHSYIIVMVGKELGNDQVKLIESTF